MSSDIPILGHKKLKVWIWELSHRGMSPKDIAMHLHCHLSTVYYWKDKCAEDHRNPRSKEEK